MPLSIKQQISMNAAAQRSEGMLGGQMLPADQWIDTVTALIWNNQQQLLKEFQSLIGVNIINISDPMQIAKKWDTFFAKILKNPITQIMTIANLTADSFGTIHLGETEFDFVGIDKYTGQAQLKAANAKVKARITASKISKELNKHWQNMNQTISTGVIPVNLYKYFIEAKKVSNYNHSFWSNYDKVNKRWKSNVLYWKHIYADMTRSMQDISWGESSQFLGMAADSFLSHLGSHHAELFTSVLEKSMVALQFNKSVYGEEGPKGFFFLLLNGKNNIALTGGQDLILTDANKNVIANIQLKTSSSRVKADYNTNALRDALSEVENILSQSFGTKEELRSRVSALFYNQRHGFGNISIKLDQVLTEKVLENLKANLLK